MCATLILLSVSAHVRLLAMLTRWRRTPAPLPAACACGGPSAPQRWPRHGRQTRQRSCAQIHAGGSLSQVSEQLIGHKVPCAADVSQHCMDASKQRANLHTVFEQRHAMCTRSANCIFRSPQRRCSYTVQQGSGTVHASDATCLHATCRTTYVTQLKTPAVQALKQACQGACVRTAACCQISGARCKTETQSYDTRLHRDTCSGAPRAGRGRRAAARSQSSG